MTVARTSQYRCSVKIVFLEISCFNKDTLEQMLSFKFFEISKNSFSYRTTLVADSELPKDHTVKSCDSQNIPANVLQRTYLELSRTFTIVFFEKTVNGF